MYTNSLSTIATLSSLIKSEISPACFSCSNKFNQSHNSLGSDAKTIIFEIPEAMIAGDLSNFVIDLSLLLFVLSAQYRISFRFQTDIAIFDLVD